MPQETTIIYVEDDKDDQEILQQAFIAFSNQSLHILSNSVELFQFLKERSVSICLFVLDINLPYLDGIKILQELKKSPSYASIPVVMFSTGAKAPHILALKSLNVEVIEKPDSFDKLEPIVKKMVNYCMSYNKEA